MPQGGPVKRGRGGPACRFRRRARRCERALFGAWLGSVLDDANHESDDKAKKAAIEARNKLDSLVYSLEKMLDENKDKIPEDLLADVQTNLEAGKAVLENADASAEELEQATEALTQSSHKMAEKLYAAQGGAPGADPDAGPEGPGGPTPEDAPPPKGAKDDGVIDAEYDEVK